MTRFDSTTVVIPTWNEAGWLPLLLERLRSISAVQTVVVADHGSTDGTRLIARRHACRVIRGGTPAVGRNKGARLARTNTIVFLDADAAPTPELFDAIEAGFKRSDVVAIHFPIEPLTRSVPVKLMYRAMNLYFQLLARIGVAQGVGTGLAVRRDVFVALGGFDEGIAAGEDADLIRRLGQVGRVVFSVETPLAASARRLSLENPVVFCAKTMLWAGLRLLGVRSSIVGYSWRHYPHSISRRDAVLFGEYYATKQGWTLDR